VPICAAAMQQRCYAQRSYRYFASLCGTCPLFNGWDPFVGNRFRRSHVSGARNPACASQHPSDSFETYEFFSSETYEFCFAQIGCGYYYHVTPKTSLVHGSSRNVNARIQPTQPGTFCRYKCLRNACSAPTFLKICQHMANR
jgi:hypothetical protein